MRKKEKYEIAILKSGKVNLLKKYIRLSYTILNAHVIFVVINFT